MCWLSLGMLLFFWQATAAYAGEVEIVHTTFAQSKGTWQGQTTLRHQDTGWEHYADAWRVVTENGKVLGTRVLYHPMPGSPAASGGSAAATPHQPLH